MIDGADVGELSSLLKSQKHMDHPLSPLTQILILHYTLHNYDTTMLSEYSVTETESTLWSSGHDSSI